MIVLERTSPANRFGKTNWRSRSSHGPKEKKNMRRTRELLKKKKKKKNVYRKNTLQRAGPLAAVWPVFVRYGRENSDNTSNGNAILYAPIFLSSPNPTTSQRVP
ncbi:hypothetical protein OUZ56_031810 [Daphnia magna]|uniref:Uncharacterized protein n=1 Tax=Daphnia magna TaxID=35525 RepID=A0ABQ9ZVA5_9CRUS|nr:hypothetical protein OUZ56_031810 [Daphnia magna]